jgi:hypothetical protein
MPQTPTKRPAAGRLRLKLEVAVLSFVIAAAAAGLAKMRTPGWEIALTWSFWKQGQHHAAPDLGAVALLAFGIDTAICFAILWGGYLLSQRFRAIRR